MPSAYIVFIKLEYKNVASQNLNLKSTQMMAKLGEMWRNMSDVEKLKYKEIAANEDIIPKIKKDKKVKKNKEDKEDKIKVKRPLNRYMKFAQQERQNIINDNPHFKITEVAKHLGSLWRNLSESEKNNY